MPLDSFDSVPKSCESEDEIRLFHGSSPLEGRVDLCRSGVWGTICDIGWDSLDADVVCRQVGRQLGVTIFRGINRGTTFVNRGLPTVLINVNCSGTEQALVDCPAEIYSSRIDGISCSDYLGVTCVSTNSPLLPSKPLLLHA
jgi:hypothetical protein